MRLVWKKSPLTCTELKFRLRRKRKFRSDFRPASWSSDSLVWILFRSPLFSDYLQSKTEPHRATRAKADRAWSFPTSFVAKDPKWPKKKRCVNHLFLSSAKNSKCWGRKRWEVTPGDTLLLIPLRNNSTLECMPPQSDCIIQQIIVHDRRKEKWSYTLLLTCCRFGLAYRIYPHITLIYYLLFPLPPYVPISVQVQAYPPQYFIERTVPTNLSFFFFLSRQLLQRTPSPQQRANSLFLFMVMMKVLT